MRRYDVLLAGIGGQGVITLGTLLKLAALREGVDVAGAERRGGAQREGPVTSNVRYRLLTDEERGDPRKAAFSGAIPRGGAHLLLALEPLEAVRSLSYANAETVIVTVVTPRVPTAVRLGTAVYPPLESLWDMLREVTPRVYPVDLEGLTRRGFGDLRRLNVVALGLASALGDLPVSAEALLDVVRDRLPGFEDNRRAFELGHEAAGV
ncbi:MAG: 2-oxoacid:acceptor oxidoreductase family protein [Deltaproteobacteria bacterium]|nr:2-oxoacid:acceptor oxidoreductase family protein [Deltaproteobacteria bacterium]